MGYDTAMFRQLLRLKKRQVIVLWLLVLVFVLPFILFFHAGSLGPSSGPGGAAGEIFGRKIPWEVFQEESRLLKLELQARFGDIPEGLEEALRQQTWERLILKEEARRTQRVSDDEVAAAVRRYPQFQQGGRFLPELYFQFTRALGITPQAFEARVRDELRIRKLLEQVAADVVVSEEDLRGAYAQLHDRIRMAFVVITPTEFEPTIRSAVTDEDARASFATQAEAFRRPAQRMIESVGMATEDAFAATGRVPDEEIQRYYELRQDEFSSEDGTVQPFEEVRSDILNRLASKRAQARLTDLALNLQADQRDGLTFEAIASTRGLAPKTVGPLAQGAPDLPDGFTASMLEAAFAVPVGQMTEVLETPGGVFVLRPTDEQPSFIPAFDDIKEALIARMVRARSREQARARAEQLRASLVTKRSEGLTFDEACATLGVSPQRIEPITRHDPLGPHLTEALFALGAGPLSEVLEGPEGDVMIGVVEERIPFEEAQFQEARDAFRETAEAAKQQEHLAAWLDTLRGTARLNTFPRSTQD